MKILNFTPKGKAITRQVRAMRKRRNFYTALTTISTGFSVANAQMGNTKTAMSGIILTWFPMLHLQYSIHILRDIEPKFNQIVKRAQNIYKKKNSP